MEARVADLLLRSINLLEMELRIIRVQLRIAELEPAAAAADESYRNGGFGGVPASAAAVAGLEKRIHHGGGDDETGRGLVVDVGDCAICMEDFVAGDELNVMPCSRKHSFHRHCIAEWLMRSNVCPLCRHALTSCEGD